MARKFYLSKGKGGLESIAEDVVDRGRPSHQKSSIQSSIERSPILSKSFEKEVTINIID